MRKRVAKSLCVIMFIPILIFSGCSAKPSQSTGPDNEKKLSVFTSFYAMYDFTGKIGGDKINLTNMVPSGIEPHDWEPSPSDIASLEKADVFVYNGAGMESWVDKILKSLKNDKLIAVDTSKDLKLLDNSEENGKDHSDLRYDPHVWLNPMNAKKQMEVIKDALIKADEANKEYYEKNYSDNAKKLDDLDKEFKTAVSSFKTKDIVVNHKAFSYLCDAYGLNQIAIEGMNADSEPSAAQMAEIASFAKEHNVKYIFSEELLSPKVANAIAEESGAQTAVLNPVEGLQEQDIQAGKDYFSVMRENLEALKKALQ